MIMKITEHKKKNGTIVYRASIYLGIDQMTGKRVKTSITGRTRKEVNQKAKHAQLDFLSNGSTIKRKVVIKTFKELSHLWLETYKLTVKPQTYDATVTRLNRHIMPTLGNMKVDKITASDIQMLINRLSKYYVNYTAVRSVIRKVLQQGVLLGLIDYNSARDIILPRKQPNAKKKVKFIDPSDLKSFLEHLETSQHKRYNLYFDAVLYQLLLSTGLRIGEACALEWGDIDLENGTIAINKTYNKNLKFLSTAKTQSGNRVISVDKKTLRSLKLYQMRQRQLFNEVGARVSEVVFATPTRKYFNASVRQSALDTRCKEAGIERFTFHAFRHTHASLLLNAGISYKELQYRLGHANISMTLDTYGHLSKDKEKEAVLYYEKAMNNL
ncbi:TPA: site-specific integrase [Streptococcus pyogenes]|uniref:tyrosine-type recombinase/integrase n=1 Tax=Streptococcus pyogenes TaxID=1314 RepID=UPI0002DA9BF6|nr:site-specific integrase [Streptococcus pyogenes]ESA45904.1 site-specific recombinase, phage integrase family [Streptococcus pyogenes GA19700]QBX10898.1 integrase [Streptococcus satellite phage Javan500]HER4585660.1 site-specific integrase [Streptococcus pyogenes NGAS618]HER4612770.1 site-specific integrase [Streptococcus pyogenes NGAS603]HER4684229.1 site-specific integrase [Streptococcus pyogenes NGAS353]HER4744415.1 site-specific integrase [Streptococcus pyogenes NGAS289]HER4749523.1 si